MNLKVTLLSCLVGASAFGQTLNQMHRECYRAKNPAACADLSEFLVDHQLYDDGCKAIRQACKLDQAYCSMVPITVQLIVAKLRSEQIERDGALNQLRTLQIMNNIPVQMDLTPLRDLANAWSR